MSGPEECPPLSGVIPLSDDAGHEGPGMHVERPGMLGVRAMTDALLVFTTLPSADKAAELAKALVEERLAACANLLPAIRSIYRWQGKLQDAYEVPEVLAVPVEAGYQPYLDWLAGETK